MSERVERALSTFAKSIAAFGIGGMAVAAGAWFFWADDAPPEAVHPPVVIKPMLQTSVQSVSVPAPLYRAGGATVNGTIYSIAAVTPEVVVLAEGEGKTLVEGYCSVCHSTAVILAQPALPAATWEAEVHKMVEKHGAVVPPDAQTKIIAYLQAHYTPETRQ